MDEIPHTIKKLFNYSCGSLRKFTNLLELTCADCSIMRLLDYLPSTLTHLTTGSDFDQSFSMVGLNSLTHLTFGHSYNKIINLPSSITHLTFGDKYNQIIDPPQQLQSLIIGKYFTAKITHFPDTLTNLIYNAYNSFLPLPPLPQSLQTLIFKACGQYLYPLILPDSLKKLHLPVSHLVVALPAQLEELQCLLFSHIELPLPVSLLKLKYVWGEPCFALDIEHHCPFFVVDYNFPLPNLPHNLISLELGNGFQQPISSLPPTLQQLTIPSTYKHHLPLPLPPSLRVKYCRNVYD